MYIYSSETEAIEPQEVCNQKGRCDVGEPNIETCFYSQCFNLCNPHHQLSVTGNPSRKSSLTHPFLQIPLSVSHCGSVPHPSNELGLRTRGEAGLERTGTQADSYDRDIGVLMYIYPYCVSKIILDATSEQTCSGNSPFGFWRVLGPWGGVLCPTFVDPNDLVTKSFIHHSCCVYADISSSMYTGRGDEREIVAFCLAGLLSWRFTGCFSWLSCEVGSFLATSLLRAPNNIREHKEAQGSQIALFHHISTKKLHFLIIWSSVIYVHSRTTVLLLLHHRYVQWTLMPSSRFSASRADASASK